MWNLTLCAGSNVTVHRGASSGDDVTGGADDKPLGYNMPGLPTSKGKSSCQQ